MPTRSNTSNSTNTNVAYGVLSDKGVTVTSEKDDQISETMIVDRNLPNPHLFKPLLYTRA